MAGLLNVRRGMELRVHSPRFALSPQLREYAERRFRTLVRIFDQPGVWLLVELDRLVGRPKPVIECRAVLHVPGGELVVHKRAHDEREAIDAAKDALKRVLDDWHDRVRVVPR